MASVGGDVAENDWDDFGVGALWLHMTNGACRKRSHVAPGLRPKSHLTPVSIVCSSRDPPMFGSNLLEEYVLVQECFEFSLEQMRELAADAVEASFLPPERKLNLLRRVEQYGF
jgi:hypothetical protein